MQIHCEEIESERVNEVQLQTLFSNIQECVSHGYNFGSQVVLCRSNRVASALAVFLIEQEIMVSFRLREMGDYDERSRANKLHIKNI